MSYPLYFLDYETCNCALPLYPGYHPQQQMVFQYSLHIVNEKGEMTHSEYLADRTGDPAIELVKKLRSDIGDYGSVIVWNKTFETGINAELAKMYPEFSDFLLDINERIYDLAITWWDMVNAGSSMSENVRSDIKEALLRYCEMDMRAMVKIWRVVKTLF